MNNHNRKITINNPGKPGGVILQNKFGEKGNPVFEQPIKELPVNDLLVTFETVKPCQ